MGWNAHYRVTDPIPQGTPPGGGAGGFDAEAPPTSLHLASQRRREVVIATVMRDSGMNGVQSSVRSVREFLESRNYDVSLVTPFSWRRVLTLPLFGVRRLIEPVSGSAGIAWYRHSHLVMLRQALRRRL